MQHEWWFGCHELKGTKTVLEKLCLSGGAMGRGKKNEVCAKTRGNIPLGEGFALTYFYSRLYIMQHQATAATYFSTLKCTPSLTQPLKTGSSPRITIFVSLSNLNLSDNIAWKTTIRVFPAALLALSSLFTVLSSEFLNIWSKIAIHISDLACHWKLLTSWACDKTKEDFPEFPDRSWFILACPHLNV